MMDVGVQEQGGIWSGRHLLIIIVVRTVIAEKGGMKTYQMGREGPGQGCGYSELWTQVSGCTVLST